MGLKLIAGDSERFCAFDSGAGRVLLLFKRGSTLAPTRVTGGNIPPHDGSGPLHIGFSISAADYDAWRQRLLDLSISIESEAQWTKGGRSIYFRDTEGHLLELITPGVTGHLKTGHPWSLRFGHPKFISANEQFQFEMLHQSRKLGAS
jgi:hypothetical protein